MFCNASITFVASPSKMLCPLAVHVFDGSSLVNCGQADLRNGRSLYVRRTDWRLDDESETQQHFAVASTHSSNHLASGKRCAEHDWDTAHGRILGTQESWGLRNPGDSAH